MSAVEMLKICRWQVARKRLERHVMAAPLRSRGVALRETVGPRTSLAGAASVAKFGMNASFCQESAAPPGVKQGGTCRAQSARLFIRADVPELTCSRRRYHISAVRRKRPKRVCDTTTALSAYAAAPTSRLLAFTARFKERTPGEAARAARCTAAVTMPGRAPAGFNAATSRVAPTH